MSKINVLIPDKINLHHIHILDKKKFEVTIKYGLTNNDLIEYSHNFNYKVLLIKSQRKLDKIFLSRCNFDLIGTASKGLDHIDIEYAAKRGIKIINSETGNSISAGEHTFALILASFKKTLYGDYLVRNGKFNDWQYERHTLKGKKIGIIGTGNVGTIVAKYAESFGMEVLANDIDPKVRKKNSNLKYYYLDYILQNSDIITVHIPMTKSNDKFINRTYIDKMKNNVIFVNTSRGDVVDEEYLIKKAKSEKNFFIALDVFKNEPNVNIDFRGIKNAIYTNHTAGKTLEGEQDIGKDLFIQVRNMY